RAEAYLRAREVRVIRIDDADVVGVWSDVDSATVRRAIAIVGWNNLPVKYLDSDSTPDRFKGSNLSDEPLPIEILRAMEKADRDPWAARDRMILELNRRAARPRVTIDPSLPGVPDEPETDWRPIQRAWSIFEAWRRWTPRNADAHRHLHRQDEKAWLEKLAVDGRSLKATLDSLERELASVRAILAAQPDRESLNRKFMA